jgi:hypothetical protein
MMRIPQASARLSGAALRGYPRPDAGRTGYRTKLETGSPVLSKFPKDSQAVLATIERAAGVPLEIGSRSAVREFELSKPSLDPSVNWITLGQQMLILIDTFGCLFATGHFVGRSPNRL